MSPPFNFDVFLSHNSRDKPRVRELAERLRSVGARVWFDEWSIPIGDDIYLAIERGLQEARVQILCPSQAALESNWVALERSTVLFRDPTNSDRRFIPLLLSDCDIPETIKRYKYFDYRDQSRSPFVELLVACGITPLEEGTSSSNTTTDETQTLKFGSSASRDEGLELIATLGGHTSHLHAIAWSPDGRLLAAGSEDGAARLWSPFEDEPSRVLRKEKKELWSLSWSPDSTRLLSTALGRSPQLHDCRSNKRPTSLKEIRDAVSSAWSSTRDLAYIGTRTGELWRLNPETRKSCKLNHHLKKAIICMALSPNGRTIAVAEMAPRATVVDATTASELFSIEGHAENVWSLAWSENAEFLISGSEDKTIRLWDGRTGKQVRILEGHTNGVSGLSVSKDLNLLASYSSEEILLWSTTDWSLLSTAPHAGHSCLMSRIAFGPSGNLLAIPGPENTVQVIAINPAALRASSTIAVRRYVNAKVVLVGESTVGKTALAHRLVEDRYRATDSTHGMNVWKLGLPLRADDRFEREALLWDFAGQPDYRIVHQLYLEDTALALLLINPQKNDPFSETGDWLKSLDIAAGRKGRGHGIVKLLVPTRVDVGGMTVSDAKINRFLSDNGFAACLSTSAKRGDNCSDKANGGAPSKLKELIASHIPWDRLTSTFTPRLLSKMKDAIVAMRDEEDIRLLRFAELMQRLEQTLPNERIRESGVRTAVTLLANQGLILPVRFGELILLRPDILSGYAGAIIRSARSHKDEIGCVLEEDIYGDQIDLIGVDRLRNRADEELLLRALVQTLIDRSLCIREVENGQVLLVFPSQYRRDREIPGHPEIIMTYTFTGGLQTIYTTLVVRAWYSKTFGRRELWQNAAEFTTDEGHIVGIVFERTGEGIGKANIFSDAAVSDQLKVAFIEFVGRHLAKYAGDLQQVRRYVCPYCNEPVNNSATIVRRIEMGKDFITCQNCDEKILFSDNLQRLINSDAVAEQVGKMEDIEQRTRTTLSDEQRLIGHVLTICADANQKYEKLEREADGIQGAIIFRNDDGVFGEKKVFVHLATDRSCVKLQMEGSGLIVTIIDERVKKRWLREASDLYLVVRLEDERGMERIRWMNVTKHLRKRRKETLRFEFVGVNVDLDAVWNVRDELFPRWSDPRASSYDGKHPDHN